MVWQEHIDQAVCGVVLVVVAAFLFMGWQGGGELFQEGVPVAQQITSDLRAQQQETSEAAESRFKKTEAFGYLSSLQIEKTKIREAWETPASPKELGAGLFYHTPTLNDLRDGRDLVLNFSPPRDVVGTADIGVVRLQWRVDPTGTVNVSGYSVFRREGDGETKELAQVGEGSTSFEDRDVRAGVNYFYSVAARTDEDLLVANGNELSSQSAPIHVMGKTDYEIRPLKYDVGASSLRVAVRKHSGGVWHERAFNIKQGQMVGARDPGSGVDFSTGCQLTQLKATPEIVVATTSEVVFLPNGKVLLKDGKVVRIERSTERKGLSVVGILQTRSGRILRIEYNQ